MDPETAIARPRSPASAEIRIRDHVLIQDKPAAYGGDDEGVMSSELVLAGLVACQLSTFHKIRAKRNAEADVVSIRADAHFDDAGDIGRIELTWTFDGGDDKERATLMRLTDKVCTISRVLLCPITSRDADAAS